MRLSRWESSIGRPTLEQREFLEAMSLIENMSRSVGTTSFIWGGFTIDVYKGRFLREHHDIDYLTLDLYHHRLEIAQLLEEAGWQVVSIENGDLSVGGDGIRLHLGNVKWGKQVKWTHNGENGAILFPQAWLRTDTVPFYDVFVHVTAPEFEYVLKQHPELLNPEWELRDKDHEARRELTRMLAQRNVDVDRLYSQVICINRER